ncbi:hypothetical protein [Streptomyces sp. NPDC057877]|uniref:hypothetical protein n=1 Tax=Streptomyces sp. NPDC057877 TaxID=3346269 RepID=UPI00369BFA05
MRDLSAPQGARVRGMTSVRPPDVVHGSAHSDIELLADPAVSAVIVAPRERSPWLAELDEAVVEQRLVIPRTTLDSVDLDGFAHWTRTALPDASPALVEPLRDDMAQIVKRVMGAARGERVMVRVFTEAPTCRCGFHVDTVPPQAPTVGAVRVYNGPTTEYVHGDDVRGMAEFYSYLARRERLTRMVADATRVEQGREAALRDREAALQHREAALQEREDMDADPPFLRPGAVIHQVPSDATVYFRHIDVRRHWSPHPVSEAWIHRSPMRGRHRLVLNVSPVGPRSARPGRW